MKIITTQEQSLRRKAREAKANAGCDICPCCGESKESWEYLGDNILNKGIVRGVQRTVEVKTKVALLRWFSSAKTKTVNSYWCQTCGAEWESDPF